MPGDWAALLERLRTNPLGRRLGLAFLLGGILLAAALTVGRKAVLERFRGRAPSDTPGQIGGLAADLGPSPTGFGDTLTLGQKYDALISRYGADLEQTKTELASARKDLETLGSAYQSLRSSETAAPNPAQAVKDLFSPPLPPTAPRSGAPEENPPAARSGRTLRVIELGASGAPKKPAPRSVRIPLASGGQATVLNGVFAPVTGEPSPVRLRLDAALQGPNQARVPLRNAFLIGKASGDPNACRVSIQIDKLSWVKAGGEVLETKALGFVVGEDGLEGVPGRYEWRAWDYLPLALGTGTLQGLSGALAQTQTTTTLGPLGGATTVVSGDAMRWAGTQALGGATGKLGEIVGERMKEIRPAVSMPAGRKVTVVFLDGATLDGWEQEEAQHGMETDPFRGLDAPH